MRPAAFLQVPVSLTRQGRVCPAPTYIQNSRPGFQQTRAALLIKYYAFLIFSFALAAVSLAAFFAAAASSRRRSMAARVAASVSA